MDIGNWQSADVQANGLKIHYYRTGGRGPVVVLFHGITDNGLCWTPVARALEAEYDVVMPDARGHGLSDDGNDYAPESHAADAAALIAALGLDRPVIGGHSMGGLTATLVAARYPGAARGVILEDPAWSRGETAEMQQARPAFLAEWRQRLAKQQAQSPAELLAQARRDNPTWPAAEWEPWVEAKHQVRLSVLDYIGGLRPNWQDLVADIAIPGLLITGDPEKGVIISPEWAAEAAAIWPDLEVVQIPQTGHSIRREGFDAYVKAIKTFLAKL
ncbi:MAG: N-formylmaleamate deformylase [Chloroflexi bacterium ADurb.Bin325]|nr:MAG: N-formylmaleamate deformylase [Chloroflexi bacterium ADurb.Bin325]